MNNTNVKTITQNFLSLKDICLHFSTETKKLQILKNISLTVKNGEIVSIVGPSGAGKTSLLMLLAGLEAPNSGHIFINATDITTMSEDKLTAFRQKNIGIVFQNFHLIPTMTAIENIALPLQFMHIAKSHQKAADILDMVGLSDRAKHYPSQLSGGEQQRVAIARAFVASPPLLLADEPTGNLDIKNSQKIIDLMFNLAKLKNTTVIMVTHNQDIAQNCDRVIKIVDGKIVK